MEVLTLLGLGTDFVFDEVRQADQESVIALRSVAAQSACPLCGASSTRIHSHYQRTVIDLPCGGEQVIFMLTVRRFFCTNANCPRRIFTERFAEWLRPHAQMTERLRAALRSLSFTMSAATAARCAPRLGMKSSPSTLLRCQRAQPLSSPPDVLIKIGLDDFAFRRGKTWGTIIIDLDTHQVVDLLPNRSVPTIVTWLQAHPSVQVISRDRGMDYIMAAQQGAPQAIQVSDRWHILRNSSEYLFLFLARTRTALREASRLPLPFAQIPEIVEPMWQNARKKRRVAQTMYERAREAHATQRREQ